MARYPSQDNPEELLSLDEVITNPTGRGSANVARRDVIKENLKARFEKDILRKGVRFEVYTEGEGFVIHSKIPSESYPDLHYDCVIKISPREGLEESRSVKSYDTSFFSNIPVFGYTYAYALYHLNWIIPETYEKFERVHFKEAPNERNPLQEFGFEKSIYFTLLYMSHQQFFLRSRLERFSRGEINWRNFLAGIPSLDEKLAQHNRARKKAEKIKKAAKAKATRAKNAKREQEFRRRRAAKK